MLDDIIARVLNLAGFRGRFIVRLSYLKLSGFKSFVDPTTLHFPGDLVGIVGPNGCGKSNVIDAVRWVLGESKASELRGESMQDVIFSGSGTRKPSGRASVELVFENTEGRITGPWGQYSEIAVKRILSRDGQSTYWINNQAVRRKDVYDLFMGTGLGPRAYAIIGQGMISRVIESRPEELRVFLEEAAGVSKYRERRKETEGRLSDTRENLARIEDIRLELDGQITRLEQQAELAQRYSELTGRRDEKQRWLWWTRREEYVQALDKLSARRRETELQIEAQTASLRSIEREIEETRTAFHEATDAVHDAQQSLYEVNTEITRIEGEQLRLRENLERTARAKESAGQIIHAETLAQQEGEAHRIADAEAAALADVALAEKRELLERLTATMAPLEQTLASRNESLAAAQADVAAVQAELRALSEREADLTGRIRRIETRIEEQDRERLSIERVDPSAKSLIASQRQEAITFARSAQDQLAAAEQAIDTASQARDSTQLELQQARESLSHVQAQSEALKSLQAQVEAKDELRPWLERQGMQQRPRLWSSVQVKEGWQTAVEAALGDRIGAVEIGAMSNALGFAADRPPARLTLFSSEAASGKSIPANSLAQQIQGEGPIAQVVREWLAEYRCAESLQAAVGSPPAAGELWITKEGHMAGRGMVRFYAEEDQQAGILARRSKIESLDIAIRAQQLVVDETALALQRAEGALAERKRELAGLRDRAQASQSRAHELELAELRLDEKIQRLNTQDTALTASLQALRQEHADLQQQREQCRQASEEANQRAAAQTQEADRQRELQEQQLQEVGRTREELALAERGLQEALMGQRLAQEQRRVFEEKMRESNARLAEARTRLDAAERELIDIQQALDSSDLQPLLESRVAKEAQVAEIRERADQCSQKLRQSEEQRLHIERSLEPMRAAVAQIDADASGARVGIEQIDEQLVDRELQVAAIAEELAAAFPDSKWPRPAALHSEVQRLTKEIESMGAVNLAALSELEQSRERKQFLDSQAADLMSAVETLEDAIRKIDRETRSLLQETFDTVNQNFGQLFPRLFGGGEAKLAMTGEEILDCGVQVMAQPPGKRNTSIHLLSGGEKALTATALVFALFQLNPAPFCLLDEVDAPLDDPNTERFCNLVRHMSSSTQFVFITHNKIAMEMAQHLMGVTMQEQGVSRIVAVDLDAANAMAQEAA
ncbi:MAG: chromosome segregation protein SMC [Burkholderiaceae bacterium]|nr:chromosome segregation protein SMC [Burkholderiaceae bacterium]